MDFIKKTADFDLISFGEVMLRLSPPDKEKISQSEVVESILPLVDALFVSEETLRRILQRMGTLDEMVR